MFRSNIKCTLVLFLCRLPILVITLCHYGFFINLGRSGGEKNIKACWFKGRIQFVLVYIL